MSNVIEVNIDKIRSNPFRDLEQYPIDEANITSLMQSMENTDVWAGIEARETWDGMYEIAFGHHRVEAARRLGLETLPLSVSERSDLDMLDMMIRENHSRKDVPHTIIMEEVASTAKYWYELLKQYPDYDFAPEDIRKRIKSKRHYTRAVNEGIGRRFLREVLGGNINPSAIQYALEMIRAVEEADVTADYDSPPSTDYEETDEDIETEEDEEEDDPEEEEQPEPEPKAKPKKQTTREALSAFTSQAHAKAFLDAANDPDVQKVIGVKEHEKLAAQIVEKLGNELTSNNIKKLVRRIASERIHNQEQDEEKRKEDAFQFEVKEVKEKTKKLDKECRTFASSIASYIDKLESMGVEPPMQGIEVGELHNSVEVLYGYLEKLSVYIGIESEEDSDE